MSSDTVELWRRMAVRVGEASRPRSAGTELGMEARDCQVHAPPSEGRADLDTQLCCHAAAMLDQQPRTESSQCTSGGPVLSAADPARRDPPALPRKHTVSLLV